MSASYMNTEAVAEQTFINGLMGRLNRRKTLIITVTLFLFALMVLGIEMLPKTYRGIASVVIGQTPTAGPQGGDVMRDMPFDDQTLGTELAILQARELLVDTINKLGLVNKPEFNPDIRQSQSWFGQAAVNLRQSFARWLPQQPEMAVDATDKMMADTVDTLRTHISFTPVPHSRVINIQVGSHNNVLASQIANTIADLYIANHVDYKQAASRDARQFLQARIGELQKDAADKSQALETYRISHGLTTAMSATLVQEQVSGLSTQLQAAVARLATLQGQLSAAHHSNAEELAASLSSPTIQRLREQEATYAADRARLAATYGEGSPMLGQSNARLAGVRQQIALEAARNVQSLPAAVAAEQANVNNLTKQLNDLMGQAKTTDEARARLATLTDDSTTARTVYTDYLTRLRNIDASMAYSATDVRVISHAAPPMHPSFPNYMIMWPASFVLSFCVAGFLGYATSRQKGIIGTADIESIYNLSALGMIPVRTVRTEALFRSAIGQLTNRLLFLPERRPKSIVITSALPQEGKTTTSYALAEEAQARGLRVMLVDADMVSSRVRPHTSAKRIGLSDVLHGTAAIEDVTHGTSDGYAMLPAGEPRGQPTMLMAKPSLSETMNRLTATYDLVIVDAPPILVGGACEMLVRSVEATVMLAKWRSTAPETIAVALKQIDLSRVAGMVLTMVDPGGIMSYGQADSIIFSKSLRSYYGR